MTQTKTPSKTPRKRGRPTKMEAMRRLRRSGARRHDTPRVTLAIEGIPAIHRALKERYGFAPSMSTLYAVLRGEKEDAATVRTVAEMFPDAILPAIAARYGIATTTTTTKKGE